MQMSEVSRLVKGKKATSSQDYFTAAGKTLVDGLLNNVINHGIGATGTNTMDNVRDTLGLAKDLAGIQDSKEKRLVDEIGELREQNKHLHDVKSENSMSDMAKLLEVIVSVVSSSSDKSDKMFGLLLEMQNNHLMQLLDVYKEKKDEKKSDEDSFLKNIGRETLVARLNANPRKDYEEERDYWRKHFEGLDQHKIIDFERYKFDKTYELEKEKYQADKETEKEVASTNRETANFLATVLGGIGGMAKPGEGNINLPNIYRYQCAACGKEFILTEPKETMTCPHCNSEVRTNAEAL